MREIHWFNFADARRPDPVDTRLEGKAQDMGLIGPSSPLPSRGQRVQSKGGDNIATTQEKKAAVAAAAARGSSSTSASKAFGQKRDRCKKGKSCGATCIFYRKDCILELPETVQPEIRKMRGFLMSEIRAGRLTDVEASKRFKQYLSLDQPLERPEKRVANAPPVELKKGTRLTEIKERTAYLREGIEGMKKDFPDPKERRARQSQMIRDAFDVLYGKKDVAPAVSAAGMERMASKEYQDKFKDLAGIYDKYKSGGFSSPQEFSKALQPFADWYRSRDVKDSEVHFMMGLMPPQVSTYLKAAGSSSIPGSFGSITPRGDVIPQGTKGKKAVEERAQTFLLIKIAMQSNFRDVYTGEKLNMLQVDMEHLIPAGVAGANANIGNNWSLTNPRINRGKGENSPDYLSTNNPSGWFNTATSKSKSGPDSQISFGPDGKLTPRSRELHEQREANIRTRKDIEQQILARAIDPRSAMAAIASLPPDMLSASDRNGLLGKIVASWTNASRTVAIGVQSRKEGSLRSVPKPHYWFGKDIGGAPLGRAMADKIADLYAKGDTSGILKMGRIIGEAQTQLLALNNLEYKGQKVRDVEYATKTGLIDFLSPKFKSIQESVAEQISQL